MKGNSDVRESSYHIPLVWGYSYCKKNIYRVNVTLKENARTKESSKAYSYKAIK